MFRTPWWSPTLMERRQFLAAARTHLAHRLAGRLRECVIFIENWLFVQHVLRGVEEYKAGGALSSSDGLLKSNKTKRLQPEAF